MHLRIEIGREDDGRWIAEVPQLPGVLAYGVTADEVSARAQILALRVLAERLEHGEAKAVEISISLWPRRDRFGRQRGRGGFSPRSFASAARQAPIRFPQDAHATRVVGLRLCLSRQR